MFKLLRRISSSVYPRPDRPWGEDATSNAPTIGRKRRMEEDDDDQAEMEANTSRKRRGQLQREDTATSELGETLPRGKETDSSVKEVTTGVEHVDIDDNKATEAPKLDGDHAVETATEALAGAPTVAKNVSDSAAEPLPNAIDSAPDDVPTPTITNPAAMPLPDVDAEEEDALAANLPSSPAPAPADSDAEDSPSPSPEGAPAAPQNSDNGPVDTLSEAAAVPQDIPPAL